MTSRAGPGSQLGLPVAIAFAVVALTGTAAVEARAAQPRAMGPGETVRVAADVEVTALANGVWLHTSFYTYPGGARVPSNGLLVRDGDRLLLIDTAWGERPTEQLLDWVEVHLGLPITTAVITHSHHDRIGGGAALERRGIEILAHPLTRRFAAEHGQPIPGAIEALDAAGGRAALGPVELFYPGPAHTRDNLMVWLPGPRILFGGCAVRAAEATSAGNVTHADTEAWPRAMERALARYGSADRVVPGHGAVGGPELLRHTRSLFDR